MYFPISVHYKFQTWQSLEPLPPLLGEIDMCAHLVFWGKLNYQQLLLATFFYLIVIFCNSSKRNLFPQSVHYNISSLAMFGTPSSTPGGDRRMRPPIFL